MGRIFFGYFILGVQKKVSGVWGRAPFRIDQKVIICTYMNKSGNAFTLLVNAFSDYRSSAQISHQS
jgi:hypothetical protein